MSTTYPFGYNDDKIGFMSIFSITLTYLSQKIHIKYNYIVITMTTTIYILKLNDNKYYIGKTNRDINDRYQ